MTGVVKWCDSILRSPDRVAEACDQTESVSDLVKVSLAAIVFGAAVFGAVLATPRGGLQLLYSAVKLPLAILLTLVITVPAFHVAGWYDIFARPTVRGFIGYQNEGG